MPLCWMSVPVHSAHPIKQPWENLRRVVAMCVVSEKEGSDVGCETNNTSIQQEQACVLVWCCATPHQTVQTYQKHDCPTIPARLPTSHPSNSSPQLQSLFFPPANCGNTRSYALRDGGDTNEPCPATAIACSATSTTAQPHPHEVVPITGARPACGYLVFGKGRAQKDTKI
jgi:hypothetical protein